MNIDLNAIRAYFTADRFAMNAGIGIDSVTEDCVVCSLELTPQHLNAGGGVQGGAIFTLADLAFAVHCNLPMLLGAAVGITVGQSCSISFLKPAKGKRLIAKSKRLSQGRNMSVYLIEIHDELANPVAEMIGNGFTTPKQ
ncbi:phenylacetic acid degradation protein [Spirochaetia bacterium]|nr:phenylacetic acid degradation protein [Spirochaetia bacterium]